MRNHFVADEGKSIKSVAGNIINGVESLFAYDNRRIFELFRLDDGHRRSRACASSIRIPVQDSFKAFLSKPFLGIIANISIFS